MARASDMRAHQTCDRVATQQDTAPRIRTVGIRCDAPTCTTYLVAVPGPVRADTSSTHRDLAAVVVRAHQLRSAPLQPRVVRVAATCTSSQQY
eukprot:3146633-Rhodomonas_salina.1